MNDKIIEIQNLSVAYENHRVLHDVNLEVFQNDFIGVIGPNGGGKTTLLKAILGLIHPEKGKIQFPRGNHTEIIGYLPQINKIDHRFPISVREVVLSGLLTKKGLLSFYRQKDKKQADELLHEMNIGHLRHKNIGELSGGQMQRVLLCRALISSPELLILDEPDTFVDNKFEGELYQKLSRLNENMAIILVSHDMGTISSHVKTIACVNKTLHYHKSNIITEQQLAAYNCPIQIITHGDVPHTVLKHHHNHD